MSRNYETYILRKTGLNTWSISLGNEPAYYDVTKVSDVFYISPSRSRMMKYNDSSNSMIIRIGVLTKNYEVYTYTEKAVGLNEFLTKPVDVVFTTSTYMLDEMGRITSTDVVLKDFKRNLKWKLSSGTLIMFDPVTMEVISEGLVKSPSTFECKLSLANTYAEYPLWSHFIVFFNK
ncbi:MAG: hypothetical protein V4708_06360 [Bacteroidota bacterium]